MKRANQIDGIAGWVGTFCAWTCVAVLLTAAIAGGCSSAVSTGPRTADDGKQTASDAAGTTAPAGKAANVTAGSSSEGPVKEVPRLLDLGAGKCIPCKMMAPILEELKGEYAGVFEVEFIDVWTQPERAQRYGVETIPTQIFFDASGKEVFRHVGFFSKEEILAKWKDVGVEKTERKERKDV